MRKCIDLESQPGFQDIYSPVLAQAIDRGLQGHSGTGVVDWGYLPFEIETGPIEGQPPSTEVDNTVPPVDPAIINPVITGSNVYFDSLINRFITADARAIINRFPMANIEEGGGQYSPLGYKLITSKHRSDSAFVLFHEYGHHLDHVIGNRQDPNGFFKGSVPLMEGIVRDADKNKLIVNNTILWDYIFKHGINFGINSESKNTKGGRVFKLPKGVDRAEIEAKMQEGDYWRAIQHLKLHTKKQMQNANLAKEPVAMRKAKDAYESVLKLYDDSMDRHKAVHKLILEAEKLQKQITQKFPRKGEGLHDFLTAFSDMLDGMTRGEVMSYQNVTGDYILRAGHAAGYYSMRMQKDRETGKALPRANRNAGMADESIRAEIWANMFATWGATDKTFYNWLKNTLPETTIAFEKQMKAAMDMPLVV